MIKKACLGLTIIINKYQVDGAIFLGLVMIFPLVKKLQVSDLVWNHFLSCNIIHFVHCDYNYLCIQTNTQCVKLQITYIH